MKGPISLFISDNIIHATRLSGFPLLTLGFLEFLPFLALSPYQSPKLLQGLTTFLQWIPLFWLFPPRDTSASFSLMQRFSIFYPSLSCREVPSCPLSFWKIWICNESFYSNVPGIVRWSRVSGKRPCFHLSTVLYFVLFIGYWVLSVCGGDATGKQISRVELAIFFHCFVWFKTIYNLKVQFEESKKLCRISVVLLNFFFKARIIF